MVCKYKYNEISELKRGQKVGRLYLRVCLVNCEALLYLQHLGIITFGPVYEGLANSKGEYPVK